MDNIEVLERIKNTLEYLIERKNQVFSQVQEIQAALDLINGEISEQEIFIELETNREKLESNIFSLYDTTDKYTKEKENLSNALEKKTDEKRQLELKKEEITKEFDLVNEQIVSNQILIKHFTKLEENRIAEEALENKKKLDITSQLELCLGTLDLDKERCAMELRKLLEEVKEF